MRRHHPVGVVRRHHPMGVVRRHYPVGVVRHPSSRGCGETPSSRGCGETPSSHIGVVRRHVRDTAILVATTLLLWPCSAETGLPCTNKTLILCVHNYNCENELTSKCSIDLRVCSGVSLSLAQRPCCIHFGLVYLEGGCDPLSAGTLVSRPPE